ncbi:MAG: H-NS histone family protein [Lysobacteraceae bacterium]
MSIDFSQYTPAQLDEIIQAANDQKRRKHREMISDVRRKVIAFAKAEGYSIEELFGGAKAGTGRKVEPKYRNTSNEAETWSGRGKRPRWLEAQLKAGKTLEDFKI